MKIAHGTAVRRKSDGTLWRISSGGFVYPIDTLGNRLRASTRKEHATHSLKLAEILPVEIDTETETLSRNFA